jgi:hypothetical protein
VHTELTPLASASRCPRPQKRQYQSLARARRASNQREQHASCPPGPLDLPDRPAHGGHGIVAAREGPLRVPALPVVARLEHSVPSRFGRLVLRLTARALPRSLTVRVPDKALGKCRGGRTGMLCLLTSPPPSMAPSVRNLTSITSAQVL